MTANDFRRLALSLPEAEEPAHAAWRNRAPKRLEAR